ncbi:MAG: flagellar hook-basal body complex protein, partial [Rhodoferax sp.]
CCKDACTASSPTNTCVCQVLVGLVESAFTVYDAGGNGYLATVYYVKTKNADSTSPTNTWQTHVFVGEDAVQASLQQATDSNGQKLYVNQYGQLAPYNQVKDELTTAKTELFSLNDLTDKRNSVPAAVKGTSVTAYDFSNGVNFKALNDTANSQAIAAGVSAAVAALGSSPLAADVAAATAAATTAVMAKTYPSDADIAAAMANPSSVTGLTAAISAAVGALTGTPTDAQIADATKTATANVLATASAVAALGSSASAADIAAATAAAGAVTYYDKLTTDLQTMFKVDIDGTGNPVTADLSYLTSADTKINGAEMAAEVTNQLNKKFGDESYFDLTDINNQKFQLTTSRLNTTGGTIAAPTVVEHPMTINLVPGTLGLSSNPKQITTEQMVKAIQAQLDAQGQNADGTPNTVKVSYDYSTSSFKFMDGVQTIKLSTPNTVLKNDLFALTPTPVVLDNTTGHYDAKVIPNGLAIRLPSEQRYGMQMTYDSVNKIFTLQSGTTGDKSSIAITGVASNSVGEQIFGFAANGSATDAPVNLVTTSAVALRGIASTPATAVGTTPLKNISSNFAVDNTNNSFVVTVDGVKATVVIPPRPDYSLDTFKAELQKGINAMGANSPTGQPLTVNGVKVAYDDVNKRFNFTTGTTGANSFIKISGSADWGLDQVEAARGTDSTWIKPTQHSDTVSGVSQPKYIDGQGNETTSGDGFVNLPAWSPVYLTKGELTFSTAGKLVSPVQGTQLEPVYLAGGKGVLTINVNYSASTQYTSPFAVLSQSQDGAPEGDLVGVTIGNDGLVSASFSNGTQKSLAKILLANFSSPVGLRQMGDSTFLASAASGKATLGNAGSAGFGTLRAGATERANVDLTQELVDLITAQRNFQANAKAIETSSTMTSAIINLRS